MNQQCAGGWVGEACCIGVRRWRSGLVCDTSRYVAARGIAEDGEPSVALTCSPDILIRKDMATTRQTLSRSLGGR